MPSYVKQPRTHKVQSRSGADTYLMRDSDATLRNTMNRPEIVRGGKNAKSANPANVKLLAPKKKAATIKPPGKSRKKGGCSKCAKGGCSKCAKKQQTGSAPSKAGKAGTKPTKHIRIK